MNISNQIKHFSSIMSFPDLQVIEFKWQISQSSFGMGIHTPVELLGECRKDDFRSSPAASSALLNLLVARLTDMRFLVFSGYQKVQHGNQSYCYKDQLCNPN